MPLYTRHKRKPRQGTQLDVGHGLIQGLQGFYTLNEGSGNVACDLSGHNVTLNSQGYSSTNPWNVQAAPAISTSTSLAGYWGIIPPALQFAWPLTIAFGVRRLANSTATVGRLGGLNWTNGLSAPFDVLNFSLSASGGVLSVNTNAAGTQSIASTSYTLPLNGDVAISATVNSSGNIKAYGAGAQVYTDATSRGNPTYGPNPNFSVGFPTGWTGTRASNTAVYWCCWWNRILSAQEHAFIGSSIDAIWDLMLPDRFLWLAKASGASPTSAGLIVAGANDIMVAVGRFTDFGSLSKQEGHDTLAGVGSSNTPGSLAKAGGNDVLAASSVFTTSGSISKTAGNDTLAGFATFVSHASLSKTEGHDNFAGIALSGNSTAALLVGASANDSMAGTAKFTASASMSSTEGRDSFAAFATLVTPSQTFEPEADPLAATIAAVQIVDPTESLFDPFMASMADA